MPSSYPSGLDALQRVAAGDSMQSTSHSGLHNSQSDAIEAIQTVLGLSPQGGSATVGARCAALESDVTGLVSDLAGKAASVHSHAQSDVTGLDTALSGKASTTHASTHAPAGSDPLTVAQSQVTGLPADLAARVTGPASSTDNTLPRFDLATGKVLQGSGVTVDDSNNISGLGTVAGTGLAGSLLSSASPVMDGVAAAGTGVVPSRQDHVHPTDTSRAATASPTFTGRVTVASGAANGISQSGTLDLVGTGSPEGVVTAPVGSTWIDTAATTGAIKWVKASGTGNTGWVVEYGDTGWRGISTWDSAGTVTGAALHADSAPTAGTAGGVYIRRVNARVQMLILGLTTTGTTPTIYSSGVLVAGWRMTNGFGNVPCSVNGNMRMIGNFVVGGSGLNAGGGLSGTVNWGAFDGHAGWDCNGPWPSSLLGSAATISIP